MIAASRLPLDVRRSGAASNLLAWASDSAAVLPSLLPSVGRFYESSMVMSFIEDLDVRDLPSLSADPFQGWAQRIPALCRR